MADKIIQGKKSVEFVIGDEHAAPMKLFFEEKQSKRGGRSVPESGSSQCQSLIICLGF